MTATTLADKPAETVQAPQPRTLATPDIQAFLLLEAELLDAKRLEEWLALYTADCVYWMPAEPGQTDMETRISLYYDDRQILEDRIGRLRHPKMFSQNPPARQVRVVSAPVMAEGSGPESPVVLSNFVMFEHRGREQRVFGGQYEHTLRRVDGQWRIARKVVRLANCDAVLWNIGVPL